MSATNGRKRLEPRYVFQQYGIIIIIVAMFFINSLLSPYFFTSKNILNLLRQASIQGFVALGMTFVIISGGIDLSVGSVVALASVLVAGIAKTMPLLLGVFTALLTGLIVGLANGLLVNRLRFQPFIATLALMAMARGYAMEYSDSMPIFGTLPRGFFALAQGDVFGFPLPALLFLGLSVVAEYFLKNHALGRMIYQVGGNEEAARLSGVRTKRVKYFVYALSGLLAAFSGLILAARMECGDSVRTGQGWELDAIAAAVIGGTSLSGGTGYVFGTVGGVIITAMLNNIFNLLGVNPYWQRIAIGIIICLAVWSYQKKSGRKKRVLLPKVVNG